MTSAKGSSVVTPTLNQKPTGGRHHGVRRAAAETGAQGTGATRRGDRSTAPAAARKREEMHQQFDHGGLQKWFEVSGSVD